MEHLSKIELIGRVGAVSESVVGNERLVRFSLAVCTFFEGCGEAIATTTWFNCTYWGNIEVLKGEEVHLEGRMVSHTYMGEDEKPRQNYEVKVYRFY